MIHFESMSQLCYMSWALYINYKIGEFSQGPSGRKYLGEITHLILISVNISVYIKEIDKRAYKLRHLS